MLCCNYAVLSFFPLQATQEELKAAYRRLCMLYHPDKHRDPELKRQAEHLFNLVHEAYEGKKSIGPISFWFLSQPCVELLMLLSMFWRRESILMVYILNLFLVLSDPQARAIYDIYGKRGLDVEGWEVSLSVTCDLFRRLQCLWHILCWVAEVAASIYCSVWSIDWLSALWSYFTSSASNDRLFSPLGPQCLVSSNIFIPQVLYNQLK